MQFQAMVLSLFVTLSALSHGSNTILFNMSEQGVPPYFYQDEGKSPKGILFDVLTSITHQLGYQVATQKLPKNRIIFEMESSDLDASPMAKEWIKNPEKYEFTDIIIQAKDKVFYLKSNSIDFHSIENLYQKRIATFLGFTYPMLEPYFEKGKIIRVDVKTDWAMLKSIVLGRVDGGILKQRAGQWRIKQNPEWQGKFMMSDKHVGEFGYRIMFRPKWKSFVSQFNKRLKIMKKNGELDKIISKYK